jgi:hypothetical protein
METLNMCKNRLSNGSSEHLCFLIINNKFDEFFKKNAKQQMDRN